MRLSESLSRAKRRACLSSNDENYRTAPDLGQPPMPICRIETILAIKGACVSWANSNALPVYLCGHNRDVP